MREVIRCPHCRLNQFTTVSGDCRRCKQALVIVPETVAIPVAPEPFETYYMKSAIGSTLKVLRLAFGYSQSDLGRLLSVPRTYISKLEISTTIPNLPNLVKFAAVFDISLSNFFQIVETIAHGEV